MTNNKSPIALIILDGWGHSDSTDHNPIAKVKTPTFDRLFKDYPHTYIEAAGEAVGLPKGQMGNSEVGHLHLGAGRKVPQDLTRVDADIATGDFFQNKTLKKALEDAKQKNSAVHVLGLLSPGGVHSHEHQIMAMVDMIAEHDIEKSYLHAILDGRDTPPRSAMASLTKFTEHYKSLPGGGIASIVGRYYAMDRDQRWDRTQKAYDMLTAGISDFTAASAEDALQQAYERGENDEFVKPTLITSNNEQPITINDGDVVIFMNFRADRARQLTRAFTEKDFTYFSRAKCPSLLHYVTLTMYAKEFDVEVAYPPMTLQNTLGEFLANQQLKQLRIAETEKYAHVTYFFNGGNEKAFAGEDRQLVPSPKVATYDLQPEMSAIELTNQLTDAIESGKYDVIVCNYANPDMVGHTGVEPAAEQAVAVIDDCMARILESLDKVNGTALITADHGNIEKMYNPETGQPHTAHTSNKVPLIYYGKQYTFNNTDGALDDVAPTLLYALGLTQPDEMTGKVLLKTTV